MISSRVARNISGVILAVVLFHPGVVHAQAVIAGVVRDASGGVLPGVTVEAASPALIEKTRVVVTDGVGQYQIVNLRPGTYTVTFTLTGFNAVKREGIELTGFFVANVNAEMRVGSLEETITVTGESPVVDVQSVRGQPVIDHKVIDAVPAPRSANAMAGLLPGVTVAASTDVGGSAGDNMGRLIVHGSKGTEYRLNFDGVPATNSGGANTSFNPNLGGAQEIVVDTSSASAEAGSGAPRINIIPKDGGNTFRGTFYATGATPAFQSNNVTDDLRRRGLYQPNSLKEMMDFNPGFGGPIRRDKVWFYASARLNEANTYDGGAVPYQNLYYGDPNVYIYAPDTSSPNYLNQRYKLAQARLTSQVTPKNKVSITFDVQTRSQCGTSDVGGVANGSSILGRCFKTPVNRTASASWTAPLTNRLLVEAAFGHRSERWRHVKPEANLWDLIGVVDQGLGISYRARVDRLGQASTLYPLFAPRASVSYVTGTHAVKVGYTQMIDWADQWRAGPNTSQIVYRFNNQVPNQITEFAYPVESNWNGNQYALYAQDKWTIDHLTINGGVRFDYFHNYYPDTVVGPSLLTPTRNITFPGQDLETFKDVTPRVGVAYDLFGDGKTAVKVSINKYMAQFTGVGPYGDLNPAQLLSLQVTRSWTDSNRNFIVDCDLQATGAQNLSASGGDVCGAMSDVNFGNVTRTTRLDPELLTKRPYNWEFAAGVQREIGPRVGLNAGYFRRWYGGFTVTDNLAVAASDYSRFSVTAPSDPRLPNGGGYTVAGFFDVNPDKFGQINNLLAPSDRYGNQTEHWNGIDVSLDARLTQGILAQADFSTGRTVTDNCAILAQVPEANPLGAPYCHQSTGFLTTVKGLAAYTVPRVQVQVAGTFLSQAGELGRFAEVMWGRVANYVVPNALIAPSLGRSLSGGAATATVNLVKPGTFYGDRLNLLDLRVGKVLTFGALRLSANLDINNALNSNTVTIENPTYGANWLQPQNILMARLFRISLQMDF